MSKNNISATVDDDVYEFLQQDHINISGLVNQCLKQYMNTGGDVSAVRDLRIQQLMDEAQEYDTLAQKKREQAQELEKAYDKAEQQSESKRREEIIKGAAAVPADPTHPHFTTKADGIDATAEELAKAAADRHGKEYKDPNDSDNDFRSI